VDGDDRIRRILEAKQAVSVEDLTKGLPEEFALFLKMVRNLGFSETIDYAEVRTMFRNLMFKLEIIYDYKFDWGSENESE
jgi:hypothetical protein